MNDGKNIINNHPLVRNINYGTIEETAFVKIGLKQVATEDLSIIIKQNNCIHIHLQTIVSHLSQIEENFLHRDTGKEKVDDIKPILTKPPITLSKGFNNITPLNEDFLEKLINQLDSLKIFESIKVINEESDIEELTNQFQDDKLEVAKPPVNQPLPTRRHYYPKPTPPSILFKENAINFVLSSYNKFIYEWIIYEQSEY